MELPERVVTTRIPWLRILAEGASIVVSILFALWIDASWDSHKERVIERQIIADLQEDFASSLAELDHAIATSTGARDAAQTLLGYTGESPERLPVERLDSLLQLLNGEGTFDPTNGTLASLLSSEGLQIISSHEVRTLLSRWSQELENARRIEDAKHEDWTVRLNGYLHDHVPLRTLAGLGSSTFAPDREAILRDMEFENLLTTRLLWTSLSVDAFERVRALGEEVQAALRAHEP